MTQQDNNPFRPPLPVDRATHTSSFVYVFACLLWSALAIKMVVFQPIVRSFFEEYGVALPTLTLWLLHPLQIIFFVACAVAVLLAGLIANTSEGRRRVGWVGLLIGIGVSFLIAIGIAVPLLQIMQALI